MVEMRPAQLARMVNVVVAVRRHKRVTDKLLALAGDAPAAARDHGDAARVL